MRRRRAKILAWTVSIGFHTAAGVLLFHDGIGAARTLPPLADGPTRDDDAGEEPGFTMAVARTADADAVRPVTLTPPTGRRPAEPLRPNAIPAAMRDLVRELGGRPAPRAAVQDVAPVDFREPGVAGGAVEPVARPAFGHGRPLHGALPSGESVVYLLDRSTSMGLTRETFDAARAALLASVQALPAGGRFQVIAYNGRAVKLLPGADLLKKGADHEAQLVAALRDLKPEGDSRHGAALRAGLALGADHLVFITDADDEELAALRPILKGHPKAVSVSVARAATGAVSAPAALR